MGYNSQPMRVSSSTVNSIGDEGACALAESLKHNTILTQLNVESMLELYELLFVAARWYIAHNLCVFTLFMFRRQYWRRGTRPRPSRIFESEQGSY